VFKATFFTNHYSTVNINNLNTDSSNGIQLYPNGYIAQMAEHLMELQSYHSWCTSREVCCQISI